MLLTLPKESRGRHDKARPLAAIVYDPTICCHWDSGSRCAPHGQQVSECILSFLTRLWQWTRRLRQCSTLCIIGGAPPRSVLGRMAKGSDMSYLEPMNLQDAAASLVLLSFAVNVVDVLLTRRGGFLSFPRSGWLRYFFTGWNVLLIAMAALSLVHVVPTICFVVFAAAWMICSQAYAISSRHRQATATP